MTNFMGKRLRAVLGAGVALAVLVLCTGCLGPNHATARLARYNQDIENRWVRQGAFWVFIPAYIVVSVGDNLIFNSMQWWTGNNPVDPPADESGPGDLGW